VWLLLLWLFGHAGRAPIRRSRDCVSRKAGCHGATLPVWTGPRRVPQHPQFGDIAVHVESARSAHVLNGSAYGSRMPSTSVDILPRLFREDRVGIIQRTAVPGRPHIDDERSRV